MKLRLGSPRAAIVVAPHPDDEVIGAYGLIRALRRRGTRVRVLVVTDGAGSHRGSRRWPPARLVRQRVREARWALAGLGVRAGAIRTLRLPDGALQACGPAARLRIRREVTRMRDLDLVIGPTPDDDHSDHRAVAGALAELPRRVRRLAYPVWPDPVRKGRNVRTLIVPGGATAKRWALRVYRTQTGLITDDDEGFALSSAQAGRFARGHELFEERSG